MNLQSIIKNIGERFNATRQPRRKESGILSEAAKEVGNRFNSFVQPQDTPIFSRQARVQAMNEVHGRYTNFLSSGQKEVDAVGQRFNDLREATTNFASDYNPASKDLNKPINKNIPGLSPLRRFFIESNKTDPRYQAYDKQLRREQLSPEENRLATEYMVGMTPVGGMGRVGRAATKAVEPIVNDAMKAIQKELARNEQNLNLMKTYLGDKTGSQSLVKQQFDRLMVEKDELSKKLSRAKLPQIMYETAEERIIKKPQPKELLKQAQEIVGNTKNASSAWRKEFIDWVNTRASAKFDGIIRKKEFMDLDNEGMSGILKFQAGEKTGRYGDVKKYFDDRFAELNKNKVETHFKADYLPQLWEGQGDELAQTFERSLGLRPSFTLKSVFENYQQGIAFGLTPKHKNISSLVGWYEQRTSKALADKKFFNYLKGEGLIQPSSAAPKWWKQISPENFPREKSNTPDGKVVDTWSADADMADAIDNYLKVPTGRLADFANFASRVKTAGLSAGVPFTSLNYHGASIFARSMLAADNPISQVFKDAKWFMSPNAAQNYVQANVPKASYYVKHGLTIDAEDYGLIQQLQKVESSGLKHLGNKVLTKYEEIFSDPLFGNTLPALKLNYTDELFKNLVRTMPEEEAARMASKQANNVFGGMNLNQLFRKKETQNILRSLILAPDFSETTIRTGAGVVKGLLNPTSPEYRAYRVFARNFAIGFVLLNVINKATSGHFAVENEGNNKFFIDTGTYTSDGKKRYFKPFAGGVDMFRIPTEIIEGLGKGDPSQIANTLKNRFSFPVGAGFHLASNQDWRGNAIYGKTKYGQEIDPLQAAGGITNEIAGGLGLPTQARAAIDYATGKSNAEQAVVQALEIPMKYEGGAFSKTQKEKRDTLQAAGVEGEALNEALKGDRGEEESSSIFDGVLSFFGMNKEAEQETEITDPLLKAFDAEIDNDKKASRIREVFKLGLDREGIEKVLEKEDLGSYDDASITIMKALGVESGNRFKFIQSFTQDLEGEELETTLYKLAEEGVLTTSVISQAVDDELLSTDESDYLRNLIKMTKGTYKAKGTGKGKKAPTLKSFGSINKISIPKFATASTQNIKGPSRPRPVSALREARAAIRVPKVRTYKEGNTDFKQYA